MPFYSFWRCVIQFCLVVKGKEKNYDGDYRCPLNAFQEEKTRATEKALGVTQNWLEPSLGPPGVPPPPTSLVPPGVLPWPTQGLPCSSPGQTFRK